MIFFTVNKKISIRYQSKDITFLPPPASGNSENNVPNRIYCCTTVDLVNIGRIFESMHRQNDLQIIPEAQIKSRKAFPVQLGVSNDGEWERNLYHSGLLMTIDNNLLNISEANLSEQISEIHKKRARIAILNGIGTGIGDTIIGISAFSKVYDLISKVIEPSFEIIYSPDQYEKLRPVFQGSTLIHDFHTTPMTLKQLNEFDAIFDMGGMAHRPGFYTTAIADFFLILSGINPELINEKDKRNKPILLKPNDTQIDCIKKIRDDNPGKKLILLHPLTSSALKSIPNKCVEKIILHLYDSKKYVVLTDEPLSSQKDLPIIDLSKHAKSYASLCFIISQMDGILTADTCIYHIADCFSIPTVVWFTRYEPDVWAKYYPTVKAELLDGARALGLLNHFAQNTLDVNQVDIEKLWDKFDIDQSIRTLDNLMQV